MRRCGLAVVLRAARACGGNKAVAVPAPACINLALSSSVNRSLSCLGPPPVRARSDARCAARACAKLKACPQPVMDDYCAYASRVRNAAEFHAIVRSLVMDIAAVACTRLTRALSIPLLADRCVCA